MRLCFMVLMVFIAIAPRRACAAADTPLTLEALKKSAATVITDDGAPANEIKVYRDWSAPLCRSRVVNDGKRPVRVKEVILFHVPHAYPPETHLYGEGFTMLSQTAGTLGKSVDLGLTDRKHYKIPQPDDATTLYGLLLLSPSPREHALFAFTSCRRFNGRFYLRPTSIQVVIDTEGLTLAPGQTWELEECTFATGDDRNALLATLADWIVKNHPPIHKKPVPTGWCSWYCFGSRVKAEQVLANVDFISKNLPSLRYVQVDDGYQPAMGDWLETGPSFGGGVRDVLRKIKEKGGEPALWVAPFIAEKGSHLFQQHPDWFMKDADGQPLSADKVTFQGWRRGPWYALDGTHPEVQKHLERLFRILRQEWGVTYFKLDANFWGAMQSGKLHDPNATRIEAYRRGMEAILRGAGPDSFILGCNHPIWPSFGLIHGSRSSGDIKRTWSKFAGTARQNLFRNWQNGRLWWNDPDCAVLTGDLTEDEYRFHATVLYATGGMLLSGDDLTKTSPEQLAMLRKLAPPTGIAATFSDDSLQVGTVRLNERSVVCVLNWGERPQSYSATLPGSPRVTDFWTGASMGRHEGTLWIKDVPKHAARLLVCEPER